jgi:hypothetical protein
MQAERLSPCKPLETTTEEQNNHTSIGNKAEAPPLYSSCTNLLPKGTMSFAFGIVSECGIPAITMAKHSFEGS